MSGSLFFQLREWQMFQKLLFTSYVVLDTYAHFPKFYWRFLVLFLSKGKKSKKFLFIWCIQYIDNLLRDCAVFSNDLTIYGTYGHSILNHTTNSILVRLCPHQDLDAPLQKLTICIQDVGGLFLSFEGLDFALDSTFLILLRFCFFFLLKF